MKTTITQLPNGCKDVWIRYFDDFKEGRIDKWYCWVCKNTITSIEEQTIHVRDIHGVCFGKTNSEITLKGATLAKIKGENEMSISWTYDNFCPHCGASSDEFYHINKGLGECTKCKNIFQVQDIQKRVDSFWKIIK